MLDDAAGRKIRIAVCSNHMYLSFDFKRNHIPDNGPPPAFLTVEQVQILKPALERLLACLYAEILHRLFHPFF